MTAGTAAGPALDEAQDWDAAQDIAYGLDFLTDLRPPVPTWTPDAARAVVLIHDMQHYFLRRFRTGAQPLTTLTAAVTDLVAVARDHDVPLVYTAQNGGMTDVERGLLVDFWGPGMAAAEADRAVPDAFAPRAEDTVLSKWRYSAFHRTGLLDQLRETGRDQLIIAGVYSHIGIQTTAVQAYSEDIQTFVLADAVADFSAAEHRASLDWLARSCAVVLSTDDAVDALAGRPRSNGSEL